MATEENGTRGLSQRDLLLEVRSDVKSLAEIVTLLSERAETGHRIQADQEDRIRGLERWRYALPPTIVMAVISAVATIALHGS